MPLITKNGWSQSGTLLTQDQSKMVSLACNFESLKAQDYTVQFDVKRPLSTNAPVRAKGRILWSVEGNTVSRLVSIGTPGGVSVTGVGQAVKVQVTDDAQPEVAITTPSPYDVSILVTPGTRGGFTNPPRLQIDCIADNGVAIPPTSKILIAAAHFVKFPVPPDSGANSVCALISSEGSPLVNPVQLAQSSNLITLSEYDIAGPGMQGFEWIPLVPSVENIFIFNPAGNPTVFASVLLGIDG